MSSHSVIKSAPIVALASESLRRFSPSHFWFWFVWNFCCLFVLCFAPVKLTCTHYVAKDDLDDLSAGIRVLCDQIQFLQCWGPNLELRAC